ncbi:MAG TPA: methyltransferase domain-containing protein [Acidimicrobiia bacterium]|nr:methyltransferase domain-containing protein [Acidimicrobiia bacterium]
MTEETWLPDWDAGLYAANTAHHRVFDEGFLADTPLRPDLRIVDLGCGAGDFTRLLADRVPDGEVIGVDPHQGFLDEASTRARSNQRFARGTGQDLVTALGGDRFDGIVSRAALQWVPCAEQPRVAEQVRSSLVPGGFFRLDMSGAGNIRLVLGLLDEVADTLAGPTSPWCFPDPGWYMEILEAAGFDLIGGRVRSVAQRRAFDRDSLWNWLESQVFIAYEADMDTERRAEFREIVRSRLDELRRHDGSFDQTFVRLDVLARAPGA